MILIIWFGMGRRNMWSTVKLLWLVEEEAQNQTASQHGREVEDHISLQYVAKQFLPQQLHPPPKRYV